MKENKSTQALVLYGRLLKYVKPFWLVLLLGIAANILYSGIDAGLTYLIRVFFEKGFINVDIPFVKTIPLILFLAITEFGTIKNFTVDTYSKIKF